MQREGLLYLVRVIQFGALLGILMSGMSFKIRNSKNFKEVQKREHIDNYDEILAIPKRRI
tara:strand:+ start:352 stop:531 length:180 start_codon:yes stop_codon:yes gene_type:complete